MAKSFVLMTALPPTLGHLRLIQFANRLTPDGTIILLCTQPEEPFPFERADALREAVESLPKVTIHHYHKTIEQDPASPGFWQMWRRLLKENGATSEDLIVASEPYGQKVAELIDAQFYPYDIGREILNVKATPIRENLQKNFDQVLPEFQKYLRTTVTIFGAESTGKTTLSRMLAKDLNAIWLFEYARPYLENTINEITRRSMNAIWKGQKALQTHANDIHGPGCVIQDTDLFSTVGYWQFPHWEPQIGECPAGLIEDAHALKSDLYIITQSNIPFEVDPLRYGGDKREGSDEYWINICKKYDLNCVVLKSQNIEGRLAEAKKLINQLQAKKAKSIFYDRKGL